MSRSGHRQIEHTADLAFELWASSEAALLCEGMHAVVDLLTDGATIRPVERREISVDAVDPPDRLVRFLNEVIYRCTVEGFLPYRADLTLLDGGLRAVLEGEADSADRLKTEIKSATYHDLCLEQAPDGSWRGRIVMDV